MSNLCSLRLRLCVNNGWPTESHWESAECQDRHDKGTEVTSDKGHKNMFCAAVAMLIITAADVSGIGFKNLRQKKLLPLVTPLHPSSL